MSLSYGDPPEPSPHGRSRLALLSCLFLLLTACGGRSELSRDDEPADGPAPEPEPPQLACLREGGWVEAAPMLRTHGRTPVIVALPAGRALLIGDNAAEVYDASSDGWTDIGAPGEERALFHGVRLLDGRVLLTGGIRDGGEIVLDTAEIFDPGSGAFTKTAAMPEARYLHAAVTLPSGRVLVTGGYRGDGPVVAAALFDPNDGAWSPVPAPPTIAGGYTAGVTSLTGAHLVGEDGLYTFDEATGTFEKRKLLAEETAAKVDVPRMAPLPDDGFALFDNTGQLWAHLDDREVWTRLWLPKPGVPAPTPSALLPLCTGAWVLADRRYFVDLAEPPVSVPLIEELDVLGMTGALLNDGSLLVAAGRAPGSDELSLRAQRFVELP